MEGSSRPTARDGRVKIKEERTTEDEPILANQCGPVGGALGGNLSLLSLLEAASIMANLKRKSKDQSASSTTQAGTNVQSTSSSTDAGKRRAAEEVNKEGRKKKARIAEPAKIVAAAPTPRKQRTKNSPRAQTKSAAMGIDAKKQKKSVCKGPGAVLAPCCHVNAHWTFC